MQELFSKASWLELYHDDYFWTTFLLLAGFLALVFLTLFHEPIKGFFAERRERAKTTAWNRAR